MIFSRPMLRAIRDELDSDRWNASGNPDWRADQGVTQIHLERYLSKRGWFFRRAYSTWDTEGVWPPPPFAERHYAIVANPGGGHFVVMDAEGGVLDPLRDGTFRLSDWDVVNLVVGLTRAEA